MSSTYVSPSKKCLFSLIVLILIQCPRQSICLNDTFLTKASTLSITSEGKCETNKIFGFIAIPLFLLSFALNLSLQVLIYRSRELRSTKNLFLIALLVMNLFHCIIDMPLLIFRIFSCK